MRNLVRGAAIALTFLATAAIAQAPARIRGIIEKIDGNVMTVKTSQGQTVTVKLASNFAVTATVKKSAADIKAGDFIGAGAKPQADGTLKAIQVVIFPEALRGTGEGHRDWGVLPETTMTNATVADTVTAANGPIMTMKYKDGEKKLVIGPDANVITIVPAGNDELKAGVEFVASATKNDDGSFTAARLTIGKNGVAPPL